VGSLINHDNRRSNVAFSVNQAAKTVSIKATRNVKNGEELLVNYGREYKMQDGSKYVTISK
jgi:SET domain-containing protein